MNIGVQLVAAFPTASEVTTVKKFFRGESTVPVAGTKERCLIRGVDTSGNLWRLVERYDWTEDDGEHSRTDPIPESRWKPLRWERETAVNVPFCQPEAEG